MMTENGETHKELRSTTIHSAAHEFIRDDHGETEFEKALVYFLELTTEIESSDKAMYICGQIREACAMRLSERLHK